MKSNVLKYNMNLLYNELTSNESPDYKTILAKAVSLGMTYQEEKIKAGINIVFKQLNESHQTNTNTSTNKIIE